MPNQQWIAEFAATVKRRGLSVRQVVEVAGLRRGHYVQVCRYLKGRGGLSLEKRAKLLTTAQTISPRPPRP